MTAQLGPKRHKLINANKDEAVYDAVRARDRAFDQLIQQNVITRITTNAVPPGSPANGDAYIIMAGTVPTGAWTGWAGRIAVWSTNICLPNTNTPAPAWESYTPLQGDSIYVTDEDIRYKWDGSQFVSELIFDDIEVITGTIGGYYYNSGTGDILAPIGGSQLDRPYVYDDDIFYLIDHPNIITNSTVRGIIPANSSLDLLFFSYLRNAQVSIGFADPNTGGIQTSFVLCTGIGNMSTPIDTPDAVVTFTTANAKSVCTLTLTSTSSADLVFECKAVLL